jgi:hypothetical protein
MTEEQEDAIIGRVLRERKKVESHLAALDADAGKISQKLGQLSEMLDRSPQDVWFHGQPVATKDYAPRSASFNVADFDIQHVIDLTNQIRDTREKLDRLNSEASKFGF